MATLVRLRAEWRAGCFRCGEPHDPKNASEFVKSRQIGELDKLPDLGASAKPGAHQANPLMDNYEGLVITNLDQLATPDASWYRGDGEYKAAISIISDDNYSATQTTRILDVEAEPFQKTAAGFDARQAVACHSTSRHSAETIALTTGR